MRIGTVFKVVGLTIVSVLICWLVCRNLVLQWAFTRAQHFAVDNYGIKINAATIHFSGSDKIAVSQLVLKPDNADTLLWIKNIELNLAMLQLLSGRISFDELRVYSVYAILNNTGSNNNCSFRAKANSTNRVKKETVNTGILKQAKAAKAALLRLLHTEFYATDVHVIYADSTTSAEIFIPRADYNRHQLNAVCINEKSGDSLIVNGKVLQKNKSYAFSIIHSNLHNGYLPFADNQQGVKCNFSSVNGTLTLQESGSEIVASTSFKAQDFLINHWRLASQDVVIPTLTFEGNWKIKDNRLLLDSSSTLQLGKLNFTLFAAYHAAPEAIYELYIGMPETVSDTFFQSLPQGMFHYVKGISCTGALSYQLQFYLDSRQPDSLLFNSSLIRKNFRLKHYGTENFGRINTSFLYNVYDKDRLVRQLTIGEENPLFTPLHKISPYLVHSVLQSEDPSFMLHNGFLPEAFRESIAKNFKEKRFARGGSTISMQLVKNVFLSRDKTISRKAEEALIVYLIENLNLVSKERMLEIYLNIIEWGPDVYGIGEASKFYFNKRPAELNLQESIFLSSIIPSPKSFRYRFTKDGKLRPSLESYFSVLSSRMLSKGWLTTSDTTGLKPQVTLKGPARLLVLPEDSVNPETIEEF